MQRRFHSHALPLAIIVVGLGIVTSCGGDGERPSPVAPAPTKASPAAATDGDVAASAAPQKVALCHYDATTGTVSDLSLPETALKGHLGHGDVLGACADACPCFAAADLAQSCDSGLTLFPTCPAPPYSYQAFCGVPGCDGCGVPAWNLGLIHVSPTERSCLRETWDPGTGNLAPIEASDLVESQVAACRGLIVSGPHYPTSCPQ